jgi:hypothetical protein
MKMFILILVTLLFTALAIIFILGTYRTIKTQTSGNQNIFLSGKIPDKMPDGLYKGSVTGLKTSWKGKKFDSKTGMGINVFETNENYPFKFYTAQGLQDNKQVIKIDYNLPENPLWLRFIVDEIVEVKPGKYLGKLHIQLFPDLVASLGYFSLEK